MNKVLLGAVAALTMSAGANAAVSLSVGTVASPSSIIDFESPTPFWSGSVVTGNVPSGHTQPIGSTGYYGSVGPYDGTPGTLDLSGYGPLTSLSFLWGTIDTKAGYNGLSVYSGATLLASYTGLDMAPAIDGVETKEALLSFDVPTANVKLVFSANDNAFEFDNVKLGAVPEPAAWMTMLAGFGIIGAAMRRRRPTVALA
jgi:hypothetical protein